MTDVNEKELAKIRNEVSLVETKANDVSIATQEDYVNAGDLLNQIKAAGSNVKKKKESITKPLNTALRNARDLFRPIETQLKDAEGIISDKLLTFKRAEDEKARIEEERIAARAAKGTIKLETAERKIDEVEEKKVKTTTQGNFGEVQVRKLRKVRIVDESLLPREYLVPDKVKIKEAVLNGIEVAGAEEFIEESIAGKRY